MLDTARLGACPGRRVDGSLGLYERDGLAGLAQIIPTGPPVSPGSCMFYQALISLMRVSHPRWRAAASGL